MQEQFLFWGTAVLFAVIVVIWGTRFLGEMGVSYQKSRFGSWCMGKEKHAGEPFGLRTAGRVFAAALLVRILYYILGVILCKKAGVIEAFDWDVFFAGWRRWDAEHYIRLAQLGYDGYVENGQHLFLVFFPLYPWGIRLLHALIQSWEAAALLLSTAAFCLGSVFFYGALQEEFGKETAARAWLLLACYPFGFFFGGIMTESLFFCLLAAGFFCIRRHAWLAAGVLGAFCSMCRIQGILLLGVGLVEFCVAYRPVELLRQKQGAQLVKAFLTKGSLLFLTLLGNVVYLYLNKSVEGDWFRFRVYQKEHWYHTTTKVSDCLNEIINYLTPQTRPEMLQYVWIPELVLFLVTMLLLLYGLRRYPLRYSAFLFVYTLVNYSVTFLISGGRYMACALPAFLFLAGWTGKRKVIYYLVLFVSLDLMLMNFYGYMTGQQVL